MPAPRRALVLIDVQQQYFDGVLEIHHPPHAESLPRITHAIDAAAAAGIPIVAVQHDAGAGAPVFDPGSPEFALHPEIERRRDDTWHGIVKQHSSIYPGTGLAGWLREREVDTVALVGYMTNNCVLASAAEAEVLGFTTEVLSDATGAVHLAGDAGSADAATVHATLMTVLHSNWAAVATTESWTEALVDQRPLPSSDLGASARAGAAARP